MLTVYFACCSLGLLLCTGEIAASGECDGVPVLVSRKEWKARNPVRVGPMRWPLNHAIIEHTVTPECFTPPQCVREIQAMQNNHMDEHGWWNIGYSFLIAGDGRVYVGNGWNETGAHSINFNTNSIGVAFIGNYMNVTPSDAMLKATLSLVECGVRKGFLTPSVEIHGHRDVSCTLSPGDKLYSIIRTWKNYKGGEMPGYQCSS